MIGIRVIDEATFRVGRDDDHRNARAVAEEADWLHIARVVVSAAFVHRDEDRR